MNATSLIQIMGRNDLKLVRRDNLLCWMLFVPFVYAGVLRWGIPPLTREMSETIDLSSYYPLMVSYFLISVLPLLFGVVTGFLLLDERDDDTLSALRVTPVAMNQYLLYRISIPAILSFIQILITVPIAHLASIPRLSLLLIAALASIEAPIVATSMVFIAKNKVQGFAIMKCMGGIIVLPLAAYFISPVWQIIIGFVPNFWTMKLFWISTGNQSDFIVYFLAGAAYHAALLGFLMKQFHKRLIYSI